MKLIRWYNFPPYFTTDSIERGIFKPQTDFHATREQIESLLADAEFYCDASGPDMCPAGLKHSARAVIRHARKALAA